MFLDGDILGNQCLEEMEGRWERATFMQQTLIKIDRSQPDNRPFPSQLPGLSPHLCKGFPDRARISDPWCLTPALSERRIFWEDVDHRLRGFPAKSVSDTKSTEQMCAAEAQMLQCFPSSAHECLLTHSHPEFTSLLRFLGNDSLSNVKFFRIFAYVLILVL